MKKLESFMLYNNGMFRKNSLRDIVAEPMITSTP